MKANRKPICFRGGSAIAAVAVIVLSIVGVFLWYAFCHEVESDYCKNMALARKAAAKDVYDYAMVSHQLPLVWYKGKGLISGAEWLSESARTNFPPEMKWIREGTKSKSLPYGWCTLGGVEYVWNRTSVGEVTAVPFIYVSAIPNVIRENLFSIGVTVIVVLAILAVFIGYRSGVLAERVQRDDMEKTRFINSMSHELNTPLTGIISWARMLIDGTLRGDEERKHCLEIVLSEAERMSRMVGDILNYNRLENGTRKFDFDVFHLNSIMSEVIESFRGIYPKFKVTYSSLSNFLIYADRDAVKQILLNLLVNAAKYASDERGAKIDCSEESSWVVISVCDYGPGLSNKAKQLVFERFWRGENVISGLGLGLSISREYARACSGDLCVKDNPNGGCVFVLTLPLAKKEVRV